MRKRILFVVNSLNVGGVERCLLTYLNFLPPEKYDITVGVVNRTGGFLPSLPGHVRLVEIPSLHRNQWRWEKGAGLIRGIMKGHPGAAIMIPWLRVVSAIRGTLIPLYSHYVNPSTDDMPEYDVAISFQGPSQLLDYYVGKVVKARKKIGWIHFDVDRFYMNPVTTAEACKDFDHIFAVSQGAKDSFGRRIPSLASITEPLVNFIDAKQVRSLADESSPFDDTSSGFKNIVTVGRVANQKGPDIAIRAAVLLRERGYDFRWTFIGNGPMLEKSRKLAAELGVSDMIKFPGSLVNPYPYMKGADIYVQPSRFEGFCLTVGEAKLFGMPVVTTDFMGALEQLSTTENAVIVKEITPEAIADGIERAWSLPRVEPPAAEMPAQIKRLMEVLDS